MKFVVALLVVAGLAGASWGQVVPSIGDYAAMPNMSNVRISPNGEKLVFISGETWEDRNIVVFTLDQSEPPIVIDAGDDQAIESVRFASDTHLWLEYVDRGNWFGIGDDAYWLRPYIMRIADQRVIELEVNTEFASISEDDPNTVLTWVLAQRRNGALGTRVRGGRGYSLFAQNLDRLSDRSRVELGSRDFEMLLNAEDRAVVRQRGGRNGSDPYELWTRIGSEGGRWRQVYTERHQLEREFHFAARNWQDWVGVIEWVSGLDSTGRYGFFWSETDGTPQGRQEGRRRAVFRYDFIEEAIEGPILQSDVSDISGLLRDWRTNAVIGASWDDGRRQVEYFDPEFAEMQEQLEEFFPDSNVHLISWDRPFRQVVVYMEGGHTAGAYYLIDRASGDVTLLGQSRNRIPDEAVGPMQVVRYQARDGLDLFGYLTLPPGREAAELPLVLMPHGGPEARDAYGFDEWAQLLATRGYAVFQPQFRGSGGFGTDFAEMGYTRWGQEMQTDLDDGVDHLAVQGIIDPDRVCIFGWSYGGYATLAGMTLTPDRYRCGIAGAGVSDIPAMMAYEQGRLGGDSQLYWARNIGDWRGSNAARVERVSPARRADQIQAPLMIVHGTEDIVVPYEQAELMAEAMDAAGRPYELIAIEGGRHYSSQMTVEHKLQLYENLVRFLVTHNPPD